MGRLERGKPLSLRASLKHQKQYKKRARDQFIKAFTEFGSASATGEDEKRDEPTPSVPFLWGDEIECFLVRIPDLDRIRLCKRTQDVIEGAAEKGDSEVVIQPEGCRHQLETTPGQPFSVIRPSMVQKNMERRRQVIESFLKPEERLVLLPNFPRFATSGAAKIPDYISDHPRYHAILGNLETYHGGPLSCEVNFIDGSSHTLYGMCYGAGMCALQVTCQLPSLEAACFAYDKLAMISPFLLACSASTPIIAGKVVSSDARWGYSCGFIDDRTEEERKPSHPRRKSRFDTVWLYIHEDHKELNDQVIPVHEESERVLKEAGVPELVSKHVAHILERYTPIIYEEKLDAPDEECGMHHFQFANSLNWHSMRLKPPTSKSGWLCEFRICDVQRNEQENAWLSCFIAALCQAIIHLRPDWSTSISEMENNTRQSSEIVDPVKNARYTWNGMVGVTLKEVMDEVCDLVDEWLRSDSFTGDGPEMTEVVAWVRGLGDGSVPTGAKRIRDLLDGHPLYEPSDGLISEALCTEILREVCGMRVDDRPKSTDHARQRALRQRKALRSLHSGADPITGATSDCCAIM